MTEGVSNAELNFTISKKFSFLPEKYRNYFILDIVIDICSNFILTRENNISHYIHPRA